MISAVPDLEAKIVNVTIPAERALRSALDLRVLLSVEEARALRDDLMFAVERITGVRWFR